jgi:hypothetical protein
MRSKLIWSSAVVAVVAMLSAAPAFSAPLLFSPGGHLTHRFGPGGEGGTPTGDFVEVNAALFTPSTSDPLSSVVVTATQGSTTMTIPFFPFTAPVNGANVASYVTFIAFDASLLGAWSLTPSDSTGPGPAVPTRSIADPEFVPLVTGITITDPSTTPTITWTLPDLSGFDVDFTQIRVIEVATDLHVFFSNLVGTPTSFTVPAGVIDPSKTYVFRVGLLDNELDAQNVSFTENRSDAFSSVFQVPAQVPAPLPLLLVGMGVIGLTIARRARTRA